MRWLLLLVVAACGIAWAGVESPRLAELEQGLSGEALDAFWLEMDAHGGPLIEPFDEVCSLVTFIYRGSGDEKRVVLVSGVTPHDPADCLMRRLEMTDLWYRTELVENDVRTTYRFSVDGTLLPYSKVTLEEFLGEMTAETGRWRTDPFNGRSGESYSILEMPDAPEQRWARKYDDVPRGAVAAHKLRSELLDNKRKMRVYVPPYYSEDEAPYPLVILFDGREYDSVINTPVILDNLIGAGKIPPCVALMVGNGSKVSRNEELPCNPMFGRFMVEEVLPWLDEHYNVSRHASDVVVGGASFGGLAAAYLALEYPECFGNVLSQSGAFWWKPAADLEPSWIIRQFEQRGAIPVRFYLDIGKLETLGWFGGPSMLDSNQELRDVLNEKGNEVVYSEFNGGHDYICWRGSLAEGLIAMLPGEG